MIQPKWFKFGIQLGILYHVLEGYYGENDPFAAVINYWLKGNIEGAPVSWKYVVVCLRSMDESGPANMINKKCPEEIQGIIIKS